MSPVDPDRLALLLATKANKQHGSDASQDDDAVFESMLFADGLLPEPNRSVFLWLLDLMVHVVQCEVSGFGFSLDWVWAVLWVGVGIGVGFPHSDGISGSGTAGSYPLFLRGQNRCVENPGSKSRKFQPRDYLVHRTHIKSVLLCLCEKFM